MQYMVIFQDGDALNCERAEFGPFSSFDDAYDFLCELPAPRPGENACKYVQDLLQWSAAGANHFIAMQRQMRARNYSAPRVEVRSEQDGFTLGSSVHLCK